METHVPSREEAFSLLQEYSASESLLRHALAVEGVMRFIAKKHGENEEKWGIIGLVHDLDYEKFPDMHCAKAKEILEERGWPQEYIRAVLSHGWEICCDVEPKSALEKTLFAIDELCGFITACALVRPSKSVMDLEPRSVLKKWKSANFAAGVNRDVIQKGAAMLGVELDALIADAIAGMRTVARDIGL
ncbi:MAG: hydrolase [Chitinispirillaceae bacterium]|nr:hydrolase [Chitinispirillaceae bacterium]